MKMRIEPIPEEYLGDDYINPVFKHIKDDLYMLNMYGEHEEAIKVFANQSNSDHIIIEWLTDPSYGVHDIDPVDKNIGHVIEIDLDKKYAIVSLNDAETIDLANTLTDVGCDVYLEPILRVSELDSNGDKKYKCYYYVEIS